MAEYRLTPAAERDLENIWIHTRQQWGGEQANRYIDSLVAVFTELTRGKVASPCAYGLARRLPGGHT